MRVLLRHLPGVLVPLAVFLVSRFWQGNGIVPYRCSFMAITGIPCPTCGFTRSFLWMGRGEWGRAIVNSPFACLAYVAILAFMMINLSALVLRVRIGPGRLFQWKMRGWWIFAFVLLGLLFINWAYRLAYGLK